MEVSRLEAELWRVFDPERPLVEGGVVETDALSPHVVQQLVELGYLEPEPEETPESASEPEIF